MAAKNSGLTGARAAKKDEFYTQLTDIEKEMKHYKQHFAGKVVFCNCDDPTWSEFWRYFHLNFEVLGLKKLVSTHYDPNNSTYKLEYTGGDDSDIEAGLKTPLTGNGDFRSDECIALLEESDICVTNPPFSLFTSFLAQLIEHNKKFVILGNINAATGKDIFPLIRENKLWLGPSISSGDREFRVPNDYPLNAAGCRVDADGNKYIRVKGVRWFTNLDNVKRHEQIVLWKTYAPDEYPTFDYYKAININKVAEIPQDYTGAMAVPITFLDKYCPEQFEILNCNDFRKGTVAEKPHGLIKDKEAKIGDRTTYARILIKRKT